MKHLYVFHQNVFKFFHRLTKTDLHQSIILFLKYCFPIYSILEWHNIRKEKYLIIVTRKYWVTSFTLPNYASNIFFLWYEFFILRELRAGDEELRLHLERKGVSRALIRKMVTVSTRKLSKKDYDGIAAVTNVIPLGNFNTPLRTAEAAKREWHTTLWSLLRQSLPKPPTTPGTLW